VPPVEVPMAITLSVVFSTAALPAGRMASALLRVILCSRQPHWRRRMTRWRAAAAGDPGPGGGADGGDDVVRGVFEEALEPEFAAG
jgi:hypothetical protein